MSKPDANKLAAKYGEQIRKQKFNNTYIPFDKYKDLIALSIPIIVNARVWRTSIIPLFIHKE